jgi:hypothetical protein
MKKKKKKVSKCLFLTAGRFPYKKRLEDGNAQKKLGQNLGVTD